jgi:hypothetical protein
VLWARQWVIGESILLTQSVRTELLNSLILHDNCIPTYFQCVSRADLTAGTKRPHSATSGDTTPTNPPSKRVTFSTCKDPDSDSDHVYGPESLWERERSTARETHPAPPLTQEYTGLPGRTIDTSEVADLFKNLGTFPAQLYVREEFARVFKIVTARAQDRSCSGSTQRRLRIVGSAGVGKSVLLLATCMHFWRTANQTVIIVRGYCELDEKGTKLDALAFRNPPPAPEKYALIVCKTDALTCEEATVSVFDSPGVAREAYEAIAASCPAGHILAVDDLNVESCAQYFAPHETCVYSLYTSRGVAGPHPCRLSARLNEAVASDKTTAPTGTHAAVVCSEAAELVLLPAWLLADLHKTALNYTYGKACWRHYIGGGTLRPFHEARANSSQRITNNLAAVEGKDIESVNALEEPAFHLLRRVYIEDIHDPASYTDPSKWRTVFDVGLAFPMIAHILPTEVVRASLELAMRWQQPVWAEGAMSGYMHQLAARGALQLTLRGCGADGALSNSQEIVLTVTADAEFRSSGTSDSMCLAVLPGAVFCQPQKPRTRYWHPVEWANGPFHAVLCCPAQKIVVLLRCAPYPSAIERTSKISSTVMGIVSRVVPADCKVMLAAVVLEGYTVPDGKACFTAEEGEQLCLVERCVGTFRAV